MTLPDHVEFEFGDERLAGDVVGSDPIGDIRMADVILEVDVHGSVYRTLLSDATPV